MADQFAINPYAPPKANLDAWVTPATVQAFPRFSAWWVLVLGVVTAGIYPFYWLYTRTEILNRMLPSKAIPMGLVVSALMLFVANVAASLVSLVYPDDLGVGALSSVINAVSTIVTLVWVFKFRNRLNERFVSQRGDRYWISGVLTFLFAVLYLQYKLNQLIDREKSVTSADPLAAGAAA
jgi:hypothetical protein